MAILIKRYANRKLYNTASSRYITLKGIAELLDDGEEVQVIDNETGEDITSVALSQILVDTKRSNSQPSETLLSQIFGRGGDVLYGALRKGVDDATEGIDEMRDRMRRAMQSGGEAGPALGDWFADNRGDFEKLMQNSMERVFRLLDLPRRSDIETLNDNLERVAHAVETLEQVFAKRTTGGTAATDRPASGDSSPD